MTVDYRTWLESAKAQLRALQHQKEQLQAQQAALRQQEEEIDRQISGMAQAVSGLASLVPDAPPEPSLLGILEMVGQVVVQVGLTSRIRTIMQAASAPLSATEIRAELQATGFYLGNYANALSTIYTTLKRLTDAGELTEVSDARGRKRYQWNPNAPHVHVGSAPKRTAHRPVPKALVPAGQPNK